MRSPLPHLDRETRVSSTKKLKETEEREEATMREEMRRRLVCVCLLQTYIFFCFFFTFILLIGVWFFLFSLRRADLLYLYFRVAWTSSSKGWSACCPVLGRWKRAMSGLPLVIITLSYWKSHAYRRTLHFLIIFFLILFLLSSYIRDRAGQIHPLSGPWGERQFLDDSFFSLSNHPDVPLA